MTRPLSYNVITVKTGKPTDPSQVMELDDVIEKVVAVLDSRKVTRLVIQRAGEPSLIIQKRG